MKIDRFLLVMVGVLVAIILLLLALGGAAFLCLAINSINSGIISENMSLTEKNYHYNGSLSGADGAYLEIHDFNGNIVVKESDTDTYAIDVNTKGTQMDHKRFKVDFTDMGTSNRTLYVSIRDEKSGRPMFNSRYTADITVTIPRGKNYGMDLADANGDINVGGLSGYSLTAATANGNVYSGAGMTKASYNTVNGDITVMPSNTVGNVTANSVNGKVRVIVPSNSSVSINAHVVNGDVTSNLPLEIAEKSRFGIVGQTSGFTSGIGVEASVVNGSIEIRKA